MKNLGIVKILAGLVMMAALPVSAEVLAGYTFASNASATTEGGNVAVTDLTIGPFVNDSHVAGLIGGRSSTAGGCFYLRSSGTGINDLAGAITAGDYLSFTVDVDEGYEMDLTSLTLDQGYSQNTPQTGKFVTAYLLASPSGFTAADSLGNNTKNITTPISPTAVYYDGVNIDLTGVAALQGLTGSTEFRFYLTDNTDNDNIIHRLDNIVLNGLVETNDGVVSTFAGVDPNELSMELFAPATGITGSVDLVYSCATNMEISIALSDESHPGSFSVLSTSPQTLPASSRDAVMLEFAYDNTVSNLPNYASATGLVTVAWSEEGSGVTNDIVVPITVSIEPEPGGLSILFDSAARPVSLKNAGGSELLDGTNSDGFYLRESNATERRFDTVTDLGGGDYRFEISGSPEQLTVHLDGANDYMTVHFTSLSGFALDGERLYFGLDTLGSGVRVMELDYMMYAAPATTSVKVERYSLWETNTLGGFALYEYVNDEQEDETLLDLWTMEGLPHPKVAGDWNRAAAEAWLDDWIVESTDSSFLNILPTDFAEHSAYLPYAKKMDATALYLWNLIWRGEYALDYRQNDEINPAMYPNGLSDMLAFKSEAAAMDLGLMFHYLSGNIGERDPEFCYPTVHPELQSWGTVTLSASINASATSFVVVPDAGVEMPVIGADVPVEAPPVISSVFTFKTFRIGNEWIQATTVTDLGNGTWQLSGVSRGKWDTSAASYAAGEGLRGYLQAFGDFVPDPNSALMETIATRWANLHNTLELRHGSFDGLEFHKAYGPWGMQKFGALVYENLDHPTSSDSSSGAAPRAWIEYKFNRVKDALGGAFQPFGGVSIFLGDESRATVGPEECEYGLNRITSKNARGFSVGDADGVQGVSIATLQAHGLTSDILTKVKNWKHASHAMDSAQRNAMLEWQTLTAARKVINGNYSYGKALWRIKGSVFERWLALGTDVYTHYWHNGQEHGVITPRFYLHNGEVQTLDVPTELVSGADRVRVVGRVLPRYDAASGGNIDLMTYLPGSTLTVSGNNSTASAVWSDTVLTPYAVSPSLDLEAARGIGLWVTGDGSGATLVIRLTQGNSRDYVVPINFTGRRWIEIPTGEASWRVRDWGWTKSTRKFMDYGSIKYIKIGMGYIPGNTTCSVEVEGLTALSDTHEALVNPTITLGGQTVSVNGTIDCENHFILDEDGLFTVYDPNWNVLSVQQLDVLLPSNLTTFKMESASSSANIWLEVGVQASNETTTNPDPTPAFTSDPFTAALATEGAAYSGSIAGAASDPAAGPMTFSKLDGPAWLSVASDGSLSGTPASSDVGLNAFTVQVAAASGSDTATLNITVDNDGVNDAPVWDSNPVVEASATEGVAYSSSIADNASDFDAGASLTYAKISGPAWLNVAGNGALSGTPGSSDGGLNSWTVSVSDGIAAPVTATLNISVFGILEAENAVRSGATLSSFNGGYTGSGYVVMTTAGSSYIEWTVSLPAAAPAELYFRHWTDSANTMTLTVNGLVADSNYTLAGTGGGWGLSSVAGISLNAGLNTIRLTRDSGPNSVRVDHLRLLVGEPAGYAGWAAGFDLTGTNALATANPDGDALINLFEYARGGNPTNGADTGYVPVWGLYNEGGTNWFEYTYARRIGSEGELNYWLETCSNLLSNDWINSGYVELPVTGEIDDDFEAVTNLIDTSGKTNEFIRLMIELQ